MIPGQAKRGKRVLRFGGWRSGGGKGTGKDQKKRVLELRFLI